MIYETILDYIIGDEDAGDGANAIEAFDSEEFQYWQEVFFNEFILEEELIAS